MATLLQSEFTAANGTAITSYTPDVGAAFVYRSISGSFATADIQSGRARLVQSGSSQYGYYYQNAGESNVTVSVTAQADNSQFVLGVYGRETDADNRWDCSLYIAGNSARIIKREGGGASVVATSSPSLAINTDYAIAATFDGTTITLTVDGGNEASYGSATFQQTETNFGFGCDNGAASATGLFDSWLVVHSRPYEAAVLDLTPVAYYRLGEASGTTATDSSGNGYDGTYVNTPTLGVTGLLGSEDDTAVTFASASSEYVSVGVGGGTYWGSLGSSLGSGFSVAFACQTSTEFGGRHVLEAYSSSGTRLAVVTQAGGSAGFSVNITDNNSDSYQAFVPFADFDDGNIHYYVFSVNPTSNTATAYVDGNPITVNNGVTNSPSVFSDFDEVAYVAAGITTVADMTATDFLDGTLDEVSIFNSVLNSTNASDLFAASGITVAGGSIPIFYHHYQMMRAY